MNSEYIIKELNKLIPNPKCELLYNKDYELLIATVLSAQCTDKRVNEVTKVLFNKYNIYTLKDAPLSDIEHIIMSCGTYTKKAKFIKEIATSLVTDYNGVVPNNRTYLESLPGVGRKTCNVVLANIYNEPTFAVDTHVARVSIRLGIAKLNDDVLTIEKKLMTKFPKDKWIMLHHSFVLFGRYYCKAKNPICSNCPFTSFCKYYKKLKK